MTEYLAGYLDGEGCIRWQGNRAYVSITNTYPRTLHELARRYKGNVRSLKVGKDVHRTVFRWEATGRHAVRFLRVVRKFLQEKRRQADIVVELSSIGCTPDTCYVKSLIQELNQLKRIDYGRQTKAEGIDRRGHPDP